MATRQNPLSQTLPVGHGFVVLHCGAVHAELTHKSPLGHPETSHDGAVWQFPPTQTVPAGQVIKLQLHFPK